MKNLACLFGVLALLQAACSKDDAQQPVDPPMPSYRFISIEYGPAEIVPDFKSEPTVVYRNYGETFMQVYHVSESKRGFTSRFEPDVPLAENLTACEVWIPGVDNQGELNNTYNGKAPFTPGELFTDITVSESRGGPNLPPRTQVSFDETHRVYDITAVFVCRLRNSVSGEIEEVRGNWFGKYYYPGETFVEITAIE